MEKKFTEQKLIILYIGYLSMKIMEKIKKTETGNSILPSFQYVKYMKGQ